MLRPKLALTVLLASGLAGCGPQAAPPAAPAAATAAPTTAVATVAPAAPSLEGITLASQYAADGNIVLTQGQAEEPLAPGSAGTLAVRLGSLSALDDFNGDGQPDLAVVVISNPGGSGTFYDLQVVLGTGGGARPLPPVFLGDRIQVESVTSQNGQIVVSYKDHAPGEPLAAEPTVEVRRSFIVQGDQVTEVTPTTAPVLTPAAVISPPAGAP